MFFFKNYEHSLLQLPIKETYEKADLMTNHFLYAQDVHIDVFWAPFEYINKEAKVIILGITPGWTQMQLAYNYVRKNIGLEEQKVMLRNAKKQASFGGKGIRKNLIEMLDGIELNQHLNINSCAELYGDMNHLLHSSSTLRYPVFIKKKNYTGSSPSMLRHHLLLQMIHELLVPELNEVKDAVIIPAGKAVSDVLRYLKVEGKIHHKTILFDFPHPSGANGHRKKQFEERKEWFKATL
ncbi:uracil-DNA glycosylase family protein [Alkalihalobacterium elongatum]|uniref:uracil-DNA glycosylase family protein n=1 Tax=Alkalihalobacterium elongatum TaxID=2675466 RepID=UPI001C1F37C4|nr:uracil-DNA glycosylase family protein [Alkalihalobacterium elongatum]